MADAIKSREEILDFLKEVKDSRPLLPILRGAGYKAGKIMEKFRGNDKDIISIIERGVSEDAWLHEMEIYLAREEEEINKRTEELERQGEQNNYKASVLELKRGSIDEQQLLFMSDYCRMLKLKRASIDEQQRKLMEIHYGKYSVAEFFRNYLKIYADIRTCEGKKLSLKEGIALSFLDLAYKNFCFEYKEINKYSDDISELTDLQPDKYGLVLIKEGRELLLLDPPRVYDQTTDRTFYTRQDIPLRILKVLARKKAENEIGKFAIRLMNEPGRVGRYTLTKLQEELEYGKRFDLGELGKVQVNKLYSTDCLEDTLWVRHDKNEITFEELYGDTIQYENSIVTQVVHLTYRESGNNAIIIDHMDHEYVFYAEQEYQSRKGSSKQKGKAKKRLKSFKLDKASIPFESRVRISDKGENEHEVFFLYFVLESLFKHIDLLKEYFQKCLD